jgi:DNA-binding MarR family transcriptional regulator
MATDWHDELHQAILDLVGLVNSPQPDTLLLGRAGVPLDRALFPLLSRIGLKGPIGVVELADVVGRDHSTVSRQVAKLESLGLVTRKQSVNDQRARKAVATPKGRRMLKRLAQARRRVMDEGFATWTLEERRQLTRLLRRLVETAKTLTD